MAVPPLGTACGAEGAIDPPAPTVGVTVKLMLTLIPGCCGRMPLLVVPSPNCPSLLFPHAHTVPSPVTAMQCEAPAAIATALRTRMTWVGEDLLSNVMSPNWPLTLLPQAQTVPSLFRAMV